MQGGTKVSTYGLKKMFGNMSIFFRRMGHLTLKFNITFIIPNLMLNIFMLNNFFGTSVFFGETAKNCSWGVQCVITFDPPMYLET